MTDTSSIRKCMADLLRATFAMFLLVGNPAFAALPEPLRCGGPPDKWFQSTVDFGREEQTWFFANIFNSGAYAEVIAAAEEWKKPECLLKSGEPQLYYWLAGFTKAFSLERDWSKSLERIEKFKAAYPNNVLTSLAEARYWSDYASNARGDGYASSVTPEGWRLFKERLATSERILTDSKTQASEWPLWYWQMIRVQALLGLPIDQRYETFAEGIKKFRDVSAIYSEMSAFREPRWGGSWTELDKIVTLAAKNIRTEPADATYTRLYWATGDLMYSDSSFFTETKVSWPRMRKGFESLMKLYPSSQEIGNNFLAYACLAEDKVTYLKYRKVVIDLDPRAWRAERGRDLCDVKLGYAK